MGNSESGSGDGGFSGGGGGGGGGGSWTVEVPASECGHFMEEHANRAANPDHNQAAQDYAESKRDLHDPSLEKSIELVVNPIVDAVADMVIGTIPVETDELGSTIAAEHGYKCTPK